MNKKYEVHSWSVFGGWENVWTHTDENGVTAPATYPTKQSAQAEIDELFETVAEQIANGEREPDHGYHLDEFKIMEVK